MRRPCANYRTQLLIALLGLANSVPQARAQSQVTATQVVDQQETMFGVHPGQRRNHTKGVCATGEFVTDPTVLWPSGRKEFKAGTLTIASETPQQGGPCEKINYDPLVMADGIAPTADPILTFRSPAYAVSFSRRIQGK